MSKVTIVPAIIGERFEEIRSKYNQVKNLVDWVQIDVVDGLFANPVTWPCKRKDSAGEIASLREGNSQAKIELHLMIRNPESGVEHWLGSGAERILFHYESTPRINELYDACSEIRIGVNGGSRLRLFSPKTELGIVLNLDTPVKELESMVQPVHFIQLMSIKKIGAYGASFNESVYSKIELLRKRYPDATISIDGGVNLDNAPQLVAAGANQLVVGSAIWKSTNVLTTIQKFQHL